ncbi:MAG: S-methyl-5-thioribose-1-phosphate isomerase [Planctomycetia bacterium]|nr:S-methyl-5-thioribose-1-phosphate isomerase [Planctomycetia bacterium]
MLNLKTIRWCGDATGSLILIDQTLLPLEFREVECANGDVEKVWEAIRSLRVRGAPAIGIAAAYGVCLGVQNVLEADEETFFAKFYEVAEYLASSRPTAVNLFWALDRMKKTAEDFRLVMKLTHSFHPREAANRLLMEAQRIHDEDRAICRAIGDFGAELIPDGAGVLTHCNAGGLATADYGTALGVIFSAVAEGKKIHVYADETRPLLQGARLTSWELMQREIPVTLICDSMAALVMREGKVQACVVGADRIASNGDVANKIGTYMVAALAHLHGIPFYVAAPESTFDLSLESGDSIPIEERGAEEIICGFGKQTAPTGVRVYNPAFDVTPAKFVSAIITEKGIISPVTKENIRQILEK